MHKTSSALPRARGRPRSFDREAALDRAMLLFWRHGYESTSVRDLTDALGITPPSLYAAFGDKRQLFLEAVGRYVNGPVTSTSIIADAPNARAAAEALLGAAAVGFTGESTPPGCLLATAAISGSLEAADVQQELASIRRAIEAKLAEKIRQSVQACELPVTSDSDAMAAHLMAVIQGMSTLARDGAPREKLQRVAATAMAGWPIA
jgi:AcrR family transcriptional regulator